MDNIGIIILVIVFVIIFLAYKKRKENEFLENISYIRENFKHDSLNDSLNSIEDLEKQAQESLNSGDPEPAFLLGNTFNDADDLPKNPPYNNCKQNFTKAVYWLQKAVDGDHADAMVVLGCKYFEGGNGVEQDIEKAKAMLCKAKSIGTTPPGIADTLISMYRIKC